MAIIDYLQDFNLDKKMENAIKIKLKGNKISAVPPKPYQGRFFRFMKKYVLID
jgi:Phosphatidylinositol-4-phosphate 5-Kinase